MRFKTVPRPPADLAALATARDALPRVPRPETDCCARLADRVDWIDDEAAAREWLVALRAIGLASRTASGSYVRGDSDLDLDCDAARDGESDTRHEPAAHSDHQPAGVRQTLADRFAEHVFAADPVRDQLADEAITAATAFERVRDDVPAWERRRSDDWERIWTDRVEALLDWWVLLGAARRTDDGYVRRRPRT